MDSEQKYDSVSFDGAYTLNDKSQLMSSKSDKCILCLEEFILKALRLDFQKTSEINFKTIFSSRDQILVCGNRRIYSLDLQPQERRYSQFSGADKQYHLYETNMISDHELLCFHQSYNWKITKYDFKSEEKYDVMGDITIFQVNKFPAYDSLYALLTVKGLIVADFNKKVYRLISDVRISHETYVNTMHHSISLCGRYLLQNAWNPNRTLVFRFPTHYDIEKQTPELIKELMQAHGKELDANLTLFGHRYIDLDGHMCDIEKLGRDWLEKEDRHLKSARDTRVLHEDPITGQTLLYTGP